MRPPEDGAGGELGLGIDFGSTALRVAFGRPGGPVRRFALHGGRWPWLLCEPAAAGPLPVTFPSLKSRLGGHRPVRVDGVSATPEDVLASLLRVVRERIEGDTGGRITHTVVSVPVSYRSAQRTALLEAARAAGLAEVRLIGDAMAAVIGHTEGRTSTTCLVYGLGYGGFELGLVRGAREHYRALGHESATGTSGRAFDAEALTAALRAVRGRSGAAGPDEAGWLRLRARVAQIREDLGAPDGGSGTVLALDEGAGTPVQLQFDASQLGAYLERHARRTVDRARTLLDQSAMTARDVDTLLLVGGGTRLASVGAAVRELARDIVRAPEDLLAHGALLHACQLAGAPPGAVDGLAPAVTDTGDDTLADAPRLSVTLVPAAPARPAPGTLDVGRARELADRGRVEEARALLETIVTEARGLLAVLPAEKEQPLPVDPRTLPGSPEPPGAREPTEQEYRADRKAARLLSTARDLLTEGRYREAIGTAHAAWRAAGEGTMGPEVLDAMIGVHCAAAMADFSPEHFPDAEQWLLCAYGIDPTNARVRELLAERTFKHAERLEERGRHEDAVDAARRCLTWNTEHASAAALLERLSGRGRNHRDRGGVPR
ncbi:Hsp70 family protein [Streptomyces sp. NPDC087425]|uniref:Hsp70 family protein n=1 Tax=unclassified Streptomyces TaxID=2593676 RepID=UPI0038195BFC